MADDEKQPEKTRWAGITLPKGLRPEAAARAAELIYNWADDWPAVDGEQRPGYDLTLEQLVVRIYQELCGSQD